MNQKGFYHNDISHDNIVYDDETQKARLVDFERAGYGGGRNDVKDLSSVIDDFKTLLAMYNKKHAKAEAQARKRTKRKKRKLNRTR